MKQMPKLTRLKWIVPLVVVACTSGPQNWTEFPPFPGAKDARTFSLKKEQARQVSFTVDAEYPDKTVVEFYAREVRKPWVPCFSETEWQLFADTSGKQAIFVHQVLVHWVNFEQDRLLLLGVRYESEGEEQRQVPGSTIQNVDLAEYRLANIEEAVNRLGLTCERTEE